MSAEPELNSLAAAAGTAATAGDFAGAAALLRQALEWQTSTLGPDHPDLATTLNNLALMLEQIGDTAEAGRCYRRAYAIALAALGPDDPAVVVSHANLAAFDRAHGSSSDEVAGSTLAGFQVLPPPPPGPRPENPAAPSRRFPRAAAIAIAVVLLVAAGWWTLLPPGQLAPRPVGSSDAAPSRPAGESAPSSSASTAAPTVPLAENTPVKAAAPTVVPEKEAARVDTPSRPAPATKAPHSASPGVAATRVVEARVCGALSRDGGVWRCQPLDQDQRGAAVYFYTRVASSTDTIVRHRWTLNGSVVRVVDLRIQANPKDGFRTYSRQTGRALEAGEWQVAVLDPTGAVLQEETFVIR